jgi:hypothetical protein
MDILAGGTGNNKINSARKSNFSSRRNSCQDSVEPVITVEIESVVKTLEKFENEQKSN